MDAPDILKPVDAVDSLDGIAGKFSDFLHSSSPTASATDLILYPLNTAANFWLVTIVNTNSYWQFITSRSMIPFFAR